MYYVIFNKGFTKFLHFSSACMFKWLLTCSCLDYKNVLLSIDISYGPVNYVLIFCMLVFSCWFKVFFKFCIFCIFSGFEWRFFSGVQSPSCSSTRHRGISVQDGATDGKRGVPKTHGCGKIHILQHSTWKSARFDREKEGYNSWWHLPLARTWWHKFCWC